MKIIWKITPEITNLVKDVEALNLLFTKYHPQPELLASLRRQSILNSAIYSARVENIPAEESDPLVTQKVEIQNLVSAYNFVFSTRSPKKLSQHLIKDLHARVLKNISPNAGSWRNEPWAIYNSAGVAIYLAPVHFNLPDLMGEYVSLVSSLKETKPIVAAIAQFYFEKIHPFADGNGRVGRLISTHQLEKSGYGHVCESEKYIDTHKDLYYQSLEPDRNATQFIRFYLESLVESAKVKLETVKSPAVSIPQPRQSFRRTEILCIIQDHPGCSFDFIFRRFPTLNPKTLHYDLLQLQKLGKVVKHGITRGAVYSATHLPKPVQ